MELGAGAPEAVSQPRVARRRFHARLAAACVLLLGAAMAQSPGLLVYDTKLDLAVSPGEFLARARYLWDLEGAFGQLQNQAYGYLWPMGPFFELGSLLDIPGWATQRLWLGLLLCVALLGSALLARALGVRSDLACLLVGFAYALSPRMLTTGGPISIEAWPSALAPWVLLPLVVGSARGSARHAAALAALAVALVGGVNAAATFAVLPLGVLWLLTRRPGPRRRALMVWWPAFTVLGTIWWLVPLFIMGTYSPPFLDFIESAANTTFPTTPFDALRGTSNWVAYVDVTWRAGNDLIRDFYLPVNSGVVLWLGLTGLLLRSNPHRLFLASGVAVGLLAVTLGHTGEVQGWWASATQETLDGVLAPLRNVHKFDPVLRLPLVLGLGFAVQHLLDGVRVTRAAGSAVLVVTAVIAVTGSAMPLLLGRVTPAGGFERLPGYWQAAATWLAERQEGSTALLVPGSSFGSYVWGVPRDEPMQALATEPWVVRNAVPLTPAGTIRMLDAVERRLSEGRPSPGLAAYLRRAGVSYLVVRNDLQLSADVPNPVLVHQALDGSSGLARVATFGPEIGGEAHLEGDEGRVLVNGGWQNQYRAIEIYAVTGDSPPAVATGSEPPIVVGAPEDLLDLTDLGVLEEQPTQMAFQVEGRPSPNRSLILTDGLPFVDRHFGRVHDGTSSTLSPGAPRRLSNPTRDYLPAGGEEWLTSAQLSGVDSVTASSSMADADAPGVVQRGQLPFAAVDGHPSTVWVVGREEEPGWLEVDFEGDRSVGEISVTAGPNERQVVRVRTENGLTDPVEIGFGSTRRVAVDDTATEWLRIEDASGRARSRFELAEVDLGLREPPRRFLVLPEIPQDWPTPDVVVLRAAADARTGCVEVDEAVRCVPGRQVASEEPLGFSRRLTMPGSDVYRPRLLVRSVPGNPAERLLLASQPFGISASTTSVPDTRASAVAAVDGDLGTTWSAALGDLTPTLRLNWLGERTVTGLSLRVSADTAARLPQTLTVVWPGGRTTAEVDRSGEVRFSPMVTDQLTLRVGEAEPATSLDFESNPSPVPVGISELKVRGLPFLPFGLSQDPTRFPCGSGPTVTVGEQRFATSVTASAADLFAGATVPARLCGRKRLDLLGGVNDVEVVASEAFTPQSLVLVKEDIDEETPWPATVTSRTPTDRVVYGIPDGEGTLVVRNNTNAGWQAQQGGETLEPLVVDGWQQGWALGGEGGQVRLRFTPDTSFRAGLLAGAGCLVVLLAVAALPRGRWAHTDAPGLEASTPPVWAVGAGAVVFAGLVAGWWGALFGALGYGLARATRRRAPEAGPWVLPAVVLAAAAAYAVRPWGDSAGWAGGLGWPHYLVVLACCLPFGWLGERRARPTRGGGSRLRRIAGRSTSR